MDDTAAVLAPDVIAQQRQIDQRRALAQALMDRGMQDQGQTQQIGGVAIRNSPIAGLSNMLGAYLGGKGLNQANQQQTALDAQRKQAMINTLRSGLSQSQADPTAAITNMASNPDTAPYANELFKNQLTQQSAQNKPDDLGDIAKFEPAAYAKYRQTHNYGDLQLADKPNAITPYQQQQLGLERERLDLQRGQQVDPAELTPGAIANAAARYNIDGTLPPLGMGKASAAMRATIQNKAAELASGVDPDEQRINQLGNKANAAALTKIQQTQSMAGAFEKNFTKNADIALELSAKVDRTGVPLVNKWLNAGKRSLAGDADLAAFDTSIKTASNEYAKIVSGSMGNTPAAEGEIKKIEGLLNAAQTSEQIMAVLTLMRRETHNRMQGFDEEKAQLRGSMKSGNKDAASAPATPASGWGIQEVK